MNKQELINLINSKNYLEWSQDKKYFYERGTYYLSHGEYARPTYSIRRYKDGYGIHIETYYYQGTLRAKQTGRMNAINL